MKNILGTYETPAISVVEAASFTAICITSAYVQPFDSATDYTW